MIRLPALEPFFFRRGSIDFLVFFKKTSLENGLFKLGSPRRYRTAIRGALLAMTANWVAAAFLDIINISHTISVLVSSFK
jgi:hypothetical protein